MKCVVIDNGSSDGTIEIIKKKYPFIELLEAGNNLGFGAANNIGLRKAIQEGYDYVYLLNQDAWIEPEDILKLLEIAERNPNYGILSPLQVYAGGKKIDDNFSSKISKEMKNDFLLPSNHPRELYTIRGKGLQAAHWLVRISALKKVGGFSPSFFHYGEDDNLCRRMEFHGYKLGIAPEIYGIHNREHRAKKKNIDEYLKIQSWKNILSDPNISNSIAWKMVIRSMIMKLPDYKLMIYKPIYTLLKELKKININKKKSYSAGAFLKDETER